MRAISIPDGPFTRALDQVAYTNQNVVVIVGRDDAEGSVLVPHVEFIATIEQKEDEHTNVSVTVPLENATFLISDVCKDFARISREIEGLANTKCSLEPQRIDFCINFLKEAASDIEQCIASYERVRLAKPA